MITVVTYLWSPDPGSKYDSYRSDDVRRLQRMVSDHLSVAHEFVVVTDRPEEFSGDASIRALPIDWTTHVPGTCFVRLFTPQASVVLGKRVLQLDLDTLIVGDLAPIVERSEDLVLWRNPRKWALTYPEVGYGKALSWFNASVILHTPGTMGVIWQNFHSTREYAKDDQWLISDYAGKDCPYWDQSHGVYRLAPVARPYLGVSGDLPENARIVNFPGTAAKRFLNEDPGENAWIAATRRQHGCHQLRR
jgi:hypothetical protein